MKPVSAPFSWNLIVRSAMAAPKNALPVFDRQGLNVDTLEPLAKPARRDEPYGRVVLASNPDYQVVLAQWQPDSESAAHEIGIAKGLVWLVYGQCIETRYSFDETAGLTAVEQSPTLQSGEIIQSFPGEIRSYRMIGPALTLHIATPGAYELTVYDPKHRRTLVPTDDCGAWAPKDAHQIKSFKKWAKSEPTP